jgi:2-desacetyl-2-hydroxyethyl bacteriochlorophyllide A dehydrogenase
MYAVVIDKPKSFQVKEVPYPKPGEGEVTLDVRACCVCGSDIHLLDGEYRGLLYPFIPGHEFSGTVREVGAKVTHVKPGDRVAVEAFISCGYCEHCKTGKTNQCLNGQVMGRCVSKEIKLGGGFSENVAVPARNLIRLSDPVSFEAGAFIANLGAAVYAIRRLQLQPGMKILVFGTGANGLLLAQLAKRMGAAIVVVTGRTKSRLEVARQMGVDETVIADDSQERELKKIAPLGFDVVLEATGSAAIVEKTFKFVKSAGKILLFGLVPPEQNARINPFDVCRRDLEIIGSYSSVNSCLMAHELLSSGVIQVEPLISHRFSLQDWGVAVETARDPSKCMRVVVVMGQ